MGLLCGATASARPPIIASWPAAGGRCGRSGGYIPRRLGRVGISSCSLVTVFFLGMLLLALGHGQQLANDVINDDDYAGGLGSPDLEDNFDYALPTADGSGLQALDYGDNISRNLSNNTNSTSILDLNLHVLDAFSDDEFAENILLKLEVLTNSTSLTMREYDAAFYWIDSMLEHNDYQYTPQAVTNRLLNAVESIVSLTPFDDELHILSKDFVAVAHKNFNLSKAYGGATFLVFEKAMNSSFKHLGDVTVVNKTLRDRDVISCGSLAAISLPHDVLVHTSNYSMRKMTKISIKFTAYPSMQGFMSNVVDNVSAKIIFNSPVIGSKLGSLPTYGLTDPVSIVLRAKPVKGYTPTCAFWDVKGDSGGGSWSTEGCWLANQTEDGQFICKCNHLTTFSLLMVLRGDAPRLGQTIKLATVSCLGVSSFCLVLTLAIVMYFEELRTDLGYKLLCHFCSVLLIVQVLSIIGLTAKPTVLVCCAASVLMFYFMLVLFAWTLSQSIYLYRRLVLVFAKEITYFHLKSIVLCNGVPAAMLLIALSVNLFDATNFQMANIENANICQLPLNNTIIFGLFVPMGLVLLVNSILFMRIMITAMRKSSSPSSWADSPHRLSRSLRFWRVTFATVILLGLSWLLGLAVVAAKEFVADVIFSIVISLTGLFVFLSKIVMAEKVGQVVLKRASVARDSLQEKPSFIHRLSLFSIESNGPVLSRRTSSPPALSLSPTHFVVPSRSRISDLTTISSPGAGINLSNAGVTVDTEIMEAAVGTTTPLPAISTTLTPVTKRRSL